MQTGILIGEKRSQGYGGTEGWTCREGGLSSQAGNAQYYELMNLASRAMELHFCCSGHPGRICHESLEDVDVLSLLT